MSPVSSILHIESTVNSEINIVSYWIAKKVTELQSALNEIVKLKDERTVPLFEWILNDLRSNEMFVQYIFRF